ncbi:MAG: ABC transporter ATP-binding protein [Treponema sp.]|jgi:NitT/TauT family transport system ATP-binding protein|nr:ABC transporter ATP-binding protein [Treponema sp.]
MSKIELTHAFFDYIDDGIAYNVLNDLDLTVEEGEFVSLIGSSGCGKSTVLSILSGINTLTKGEFFIDKKLINGPGKDRGIVFQHYSLFPWMTSKKNISFGLKQINDGMQQRVAIARTLALGSDILLMDEPFGAIDAKNKLILQEFLLEILSKEDKKRTVVFVTHDVDEAILLSDRVLFMYNKKIDQDIRVDFPRPRKREEFATTTNYKSIRERIMALFFRDVMENIGGNEVVI